jgi:hypothetical protein
VKTRHGNGSVDQALQPFSKLPTLSEPMVLGCRAVPGIHYMFVKSYPACTRMIATRPAY